MCFSTALMKVREQSKTGYDINSFPGSLFFPRYENREGLGTTSTSFPGPSCFKGMRIQ